MLHSFQSLWALVIGIVLLIAQGLSTPLEKREPKCTDIVIPVTISAMNAQISQLLVELLPIATLFETLLGSVFSFTVPVHGTYSISARYCEPEEYVEARYQTLQVLVHGINYNKNYCKHTHSLSLSLTDPVLFGVQYISYSIHFSNEET